MSRLSRILVALLVLLACAAAGAQPGYWGGTSGGQFRVAPSADADGYYLVVQYSGTVAPQVETRLHGRSLDIRVSQAGGGAGRFFRNRMTRSFPLPPDADPSRMTRREEPGRIVVALPRRAVPPGPRW